MTKSFSQKTKHRIVQRYQVGESIKSICEDTHIARSTLYSWINLYQARITNTGVIVTPKEFDSMKRRLRKLEDIIAVLKTVECLPSSSLKQKLVAAEVLYGQYSVHTICEVLNISRGTFYNHILRNKRDDAWFSKRREDLKSTIQSAYDNSNQIFGASKIRVVLIEQGYTISEKMVSELMREMGLRSIRATSKKDHLMLGWEHRKSNVLKQHFDADAPDKVWVSDVTCYKLKDNYHHICVFIDLFSRKVLSLAIGRNNSTNLVRTAFVAAIKDRNPSSLIVHTDRGAPYTSYTMRRLTRKYSIVQSFSYPGKPHDNAVMESFFASLEREKLYRV